MVFIMFCFFLRTGVLEVFKSIISLVIIAFCFFLWTCLSCSIISLKFILFCLFLGDCVQILYCFLYSAFYVAFCIYNYLIENFLILFFTRKCTSIVVNWITRCFTISLKWIWITQSCAWWNMMHFIYMS